MNARAPLPLVDDRNPPIYTNRPQKVLAWLGYLLVALPVLLQAFLCAIEDDGDANSTYYISTTMVLNFGSCLISIFGWLLIFLFLSGYSMDARAVPLPPVDDHNPSIYPNTPPKVLAWLGFILVALPALLQLLLCAADVDGNSYTTYYISTTMVLNLGSYLIFVFGWLLVFLSIGVGARAGGRLVVLR